MADNHAPTSSSPEEDPTRPPSSATDNSSEKSLVVFHGPPAIINPSLSESMQQRDSIQKIMLEKDELEKKLAQKVQELEKAHSTIEMLQKKETGAVPWSPQIVTCHHCSCAILADYYDRKSFRYSENPNIHELFLRRGCIDDDTKCIHTCNSQEENPMGEGVLIAMLGPPFERYILPAENIIDDKPTYVIPNEQNGVCESMLLKVAYEQAKAAKYILCRTTFDDKSMLIEPGVTASALKWLVGQWPQWRANYKLHTLIICIPYGGKYKREEEDAVNEAHSRGIIIVCAAGWRGTGIAFPAKFGSVICVGSEQCDGTVAPYSPRGRELDIVGPGSVRFGRNYIIGPAVSAAFVAGKLASIFQHYHSAKIPITDDVDTCVIKERFESTSPHSVENGFGRLDASSFTTAWPKEQVKRDLNIILYFRDRRLIDSDKLPIDAAKNKERWSSAAIIKHYRQYNKDFQAIKGVNITIAIIDEFSESFLTHVKLRHQVKVCQHDINKVYVEYFYLKPADMVNAFCCVKFCKYAKGHALQCAAIIANTAPKSTLLMIRYNKTDNDFKVALDLVKNLKPPADILLLSSVTMDAYDRNYMCNISSHLQSRIVICAAGNEGETDINTICYPSRFGNVITVGACNRTGKRCSYSSVGRQVDFLCPGQFSIADPSGTGYTCYASSAAAACIALFLEYSDNILRSHLSQEHYQSMKNHVRNTHFMRALLSSNTLNLCQRKEHNSTDGYGMLLIDALFSLEPVTIMQEIENFYSVVPI